MHVSADGVTLGMAQPPSRSLFALAGELLGGLLGVREAHAAVASHSYVTDRQGRFIVTITSPVTGPLTLHMRAGENEQTITLNAAATAGLKMSALSSALLTQGTQTEVTFTFTRDGVPQADLAVEFAANAAFAELAQGAKGETKNDGTVTLDLTPETEGLVTVTATVDEQTLNATLVVGLMGITTTNTDSATPLRFDKPRKVQIFLVGRLPTQAQALPLSNVTVALEGQDIGGLPATATTGSDGSLTLSLTATGDSLDTRFFDVLVNTRVVGTIALPVQASKP